MFRGLKVIILFSNELTTLLFPVVLRHAEFLRYNEDAFAGCVLWNKWSLWPSIPFEQWLDAQFSEGPASIGNRSLLKPARRIKRTSSKLEAREDDFTLMRFPSRSKQFFSCHPTFLNPKQQFVVIVPAAMLITTPSPS
ncbi:hypothetical protein MUK42_33084 [Musa troglodytarum]|uniref:Uncharacterized protein n=1 Tax=Musa troglodytarum TaxID=320322 RepID=A0A9E7FDQ3_9LILI|nr:hypothetical protein MUK42_33084 [Musa troglodytarum]